MVTALHIQVVGNDRTVLTTCFNSANASWTSLSSNARLIKPSAHTRADFINECKAGAFDGVLVVYRTFESVELTGRFDEELVRLLPASVKFICHNGMYIFWPRRAFDPPWETRRLMSSIKGAGYDQIDVGACTARGISVSNAPHVVNDSTADTAIFLMLGALRKFNASMTTLREGSWRGYSLPPLGRDPEGKTLGILGMGGIGRNLKRKAEAFGIRVIYHNRNKLSKPLAGGAEFVSFDDLLSMSDIISINVPLNVSLASYNVQASCRLKSSHAKIL